MGQLLTMSVNDWSAVYNAPAPTAHPDADPHPDAGRLTPASSVPAWGPPARFHGAVAPSVRVTGGAAGVPGALERGALRDELGRCGGGIELAAGDLLQQACELRVGLEAALELRTHAQRGDREHLLAEVAAAALLELPVDFR